MRKILISFAAILMTGSIFAGGLVTNTNQSALFTRLQNRNASTSVDAVYYNPAGLTNLGEGFFASINNQTISQRQTITSEYPTLKGIPREYIGKVSAPIFPSVYVALNVGNFSFSAGFNPIGGGGGATYAGGLPSFESMVSNLPTGLNLQGIPTTDYDADIFFEGSSVYFGYQFNAGYRINHVLSIAGGIRFVTAKNTYNGYMKNISINPNYPAFGNYTGEMVSAPEFFTAGAATLATLSNGASQLNTGLQPIITGGGGGVLLSNGTVVGLSAQQIGQIQQIMGAAGQTPAQIGSATIAYAQAVLGAAAPVFNEKSATMNGLAAQTQDILVDAERKGTGITPIVSMNISAAEDLNISIRYEFQTKLDLTTKVTDNMGGPLFVDGKVVSADMPAQLAIGFEYNPVRTLRLAASFNTYFDNKVDYDGDPEVDVDMIDRNFIEYGLGVEYGLGAKLRASAGWVATSTGVNSNYQSDMEFDVNTNSVGGGFGYKLNRNIDLNLGGQYTFYGQDSKSFETFTKRTWLVAVGVDFLFGVK